MSENASLFHILSWACLFLGWMGLSILAFPLGIYLAGQAMEGGVDAALARKLNSWSLILVIVLIVLAFLAFLLFAFV
ncbi:hypothetical protein AB4027_11210 [Alkalibacterium putridalgicola]|jgi:hypothetical protein|uniref:Uncharacterized protein n=1 Tax=Alkalibacterium putridalgicola TaxID=426703 RepID=A0A1H7VRY7_9LACT|nr:hypothetical protein [Alkalibacterium putridalgicola]GEK89866.1 hypothetical protein APU01nite_19050 [Alkalibacterium putridalgicola]SEM11649.1 hypothetical protein SAMN04488100_12638 [Alkalibacterium putridalgicola]